MSDPDLSELRAMEAVLTALHSLKTDAQVRVLRWTAERLEIGLDMKLAFRNAGPTANRNYIELAHDRALHGLDSPREFLAAAKPRSIVDRVLIVATSIQFNKDDPDRALLPVREIGAVLRIVGKPVQNVTDCLNTLMQRKPPHVTRLPLEAGSLTKYGYHVTEAGIDHVYKLAVFRNNEVT